MTTIEHIIALPLPGIRDGNLRHKPRKEWAGAVRGLLKEFGVEGVSVTTPSYSMASSVYISIPSIEHDHMPDQWARDCEHCQLKQAAETKLEAILLAAFPDMDDRSDTQTDYFDYCFSIR